jgi:osmotically-inducible protein OsmY
MTLKKLFLLLVVFGLCCSSYGIDYYYETDTGNEIKLSDEDLTRKIRGRLRLAWSDRWFDYVSVEVSHGATSLQGSVKTWEDKRDVESIVKNTPGVKEVLSKIRVQNIVSKERQKSYLSDSAATGGDGEINRMIREHIKAAWFGNGYKEVSLNTARGVVIIEGSVDNLTDQQRLIAEIHKVNGVSSVISHLTIKNQQEKQTQN